MKPVLLAFCLILAACAGKPAAPTVRLGIIGMARNLSVNRWKILCSS